MEPTSTSRSALPGRPGNLTAEQEKKLKELWQATLKIFGTTAGDGKTDDPASEDELRNGQQSGTDTIEKKKKRRGLFGKKNNEKSAESKTPKPADGEDKYGQTKVFEETLASQSPKEIRDSFWDMVKHDDPDGLLLRFLRARWALS